MNKNQSIQHVEDLILNGVDGINDATLFFRELEKTFSDQTSKSIKTSLKWDGSPSIVCGTNPENGKFFVGTKSVFNKTPKINYNIKDIQENHKSNKNLIWILSLLLKHLPELNMDGIYQGDLLFWPRLIRQRIIEGKKYLMFKPNSITYAVEKDSFSGKNIQSSQIGIVFHTKHTGRKMKTLKIDYNPDISHFNDSKAVWFIDSSYNDIKGLTKTEKEYIHKELNSMEGGFGLEFFKELDKTPKIKTYLTRYINHNIKHNIKKFSSVSFISWLSYRIEEEKRKLKSVKGKKNRDDIKAVIFSFIENNKKNFDLFFKTRNRLLKIKNIFINKINSSNKDIHTFFDIGNTVKRTAPEGLVVSALGGRKIVKLIDRTEFSRKNFTISERK